MIEEKIGMPVEDQYLTFNDVLLLDNGVTLSQTGVVNLDTLVLKEQGFCLGDQFWEGSTWPCDSTDPERDWGPPTWSDQNNMKKNLRFDRCRGMDGANIEYKNAHGDYICVEADRDGGGIKGHDLCSGITTYEEA